MGVSILHAYNRTLDRPPVVGRRPRAPIPIDFVLFALTLAGVALFHHHTLRVALTGLAVIVVYKVLASPVQPGRGPDRLARTSGTSG